MEEIPKSFSLPPGQEVSKYFLNLLIEFKKEIENTKDIDLLKIEMAKFLNAIKELYFEKSKKDIYKKEESTKIISKIWSEFKRYIDFLEKKEKTNNIQDLLDSLDELKKMIKDKKII